MYCGKCGAEVSNNVAFCPDCGEQISAQIANGQVKNKTKKSKTLKIFIPTLIVIIAIVVAGVIIFTNKSGCEKVIDNYYKAIQTQDVFLMKSTLAQYFIDYETADYDTDEYLLSDLQDLIEEDIEDYDCGENIKITYTITSEKKATEDDLVALKDNIYDWYAYYVTSEEKFNNSINDACVLNVRFKVIGAEDADGFTTKFLVVKENGKWKIALGSLDNSFYSNY